MKKKNDIKIFALSSFLNDLGSDMIYPIWPHFIRNVLGANMTILGLLDGIGEAIVSISQAISGYYSDKIKKRKIFIWMGYLMGSLSRIGYSLSPTWQTVIPFRILDRAGKIRSAPRDAIIAESSTNNDRGKNFGILRTADNLGAVTGILLCLLLINLIDLRTIFFIAAIPSVFSVLLIYLFIKESSSNSTQIFSGLKLNIFSKDFKLFLLTSGIFSLASFSYSFLLIFTQDSGLKIYTLPIFYLIFNISATLSSYPFGFFSDKFGRKITIQVTYLIWIIVCIGFIFSNSMLAFIVLFILYGLQRGAFDTVQRAFVAELGPQEFRASSLGGYQLVIGLCALPASLIAGIIWDTFGKNFVMLYSIILSCISLFLLTFIKENR